MFRNDRTAKIRLIADDEVGLPPDAQREEVGGAKAGQPIRR